jgi:hypothetical protein
MRVALLSILIPAAVVLAGCQTQPYASGHVQADALMAELQAESTATGVAATAISVAGSADPSGMGAGAAHAINRTMLDAHSAQVNARIQNRIMGQEMAVMKCVEDSKAMAGKAAEDYADACARRARGLAPN